MLGQDLLEINNIPSCFVGMGTDNTVNVLIFYCKMMDMRISRRQSALSQCINLNMDNPVSVTSYIIYLISLKIDIQPLLLRNNSINRSKYLILILKQHCPTSRKLNV